MPNTNTSIEISKKLNKDITIVTTLLNEPKKKFIEDILKKALKPHLKKIIRYRFS